MASMGSFDYLWGPMALQFYTYRIWLDLWDCSVASMWVSVLSDCFGFVWQLW
jgi:hypothetical protein